MLGSRLCDSEVQSTARSLEFRCSVQFIVVKSFVGSRLCDFDIRLVSYLSLNAVYVKCSEHMSVRIGIKPDSEY